MIVRLQMVLEFLPHIKTAVVRGDCTEFVNGVRLWPQRAEPPDDGRLYIRQKESAVHSAQQAKTVELLVGDSCLEVQGAGVQQLANEIFELLDRLARWESLAQQCIISGASLQRLLDTCGFIFDNPCFLCDMRGNAVAMSQQYKLGEVDEDWDYILTHHRPPMQAISEQLKAPDGTVYADWDAVPRIFQMPKRIIGQYILADSEYLGAFCIHEHKTALTQSMCELAAQFCRYISLVISGQNSDELQSNRMLLVEAVEEKHVDYGGLSNLLAAAFGPGSHRLALVSFINNRRSDLTYREGLKKEIEQTALPSIAFDYKAYLLCLVRQDDIQALTSAIKDSRPLINYTVGISMPFSQPDGLALAYRQTLFALQQGGQSGHTVCHCQNYAFEYLLGQMRTHGSEMELLHPALRILREYDEKKNTDFYETLRLYLTHERNLVDTAKAMFIHRNSLVYRIKRIQQLMQSELADPSERLYIQISYEIESARHGASAG